jgi:outer membrane lipoprotein-sorting protein
MIDIKALLAAAAVAALALPGVSQADPRADVQRALERVVAGGGFRAQVTGAVFGPGTPVTSGEIDVVFPDRIHARTEMIDFITTREGAWINLFGIWTPVDRDQIPVTGFAPSAMRKAIASIGDVRADGTVMTNRCEEHIYRFRASGQLPGATADGDARIWICASDGRPVRLEATDAASGGRINLVFDWSRAARVNAPEE